MSSEPTAGKDKGEGSMDKRHAGTRAIPTRQMFYEILQAAMILPMAQFR